MPRPGLARLPVGDRRAHHGDQPVESGGELPHLFFPLRRLLVHALQRFGFLAAAVGLLALRLQQQAGLVLGGARGQLGDSQRVLPAAGGGGDASQRRLEAEDRPLVLRGGILQDRVLLPLVLLRHRHPTPGSRPA